LPLSFDKGLCKVSFLFLRCAILLLWFSVQQFFLVQYSIFVNVLQCIRYNCVRSYCFFSISFYFITLTPFFYYSVKLYLSNIMFFLLDFEKDLEQGQNVVDSTFKHIFALLIVCKINNFTSFYHNILLLSLPVFGF